MKLVSFFLTLAVNIAIGVVVFFFLLIAMNGYSESDATYGLVVYGILAFLVSLLMAGSALVTSHLLMKRKFSGTSALFISVPIVWVVGALLKLVCAGIGTAVAEFVRVNY